MTPLFEGAPGFLWRLAAAGRPFRAPEGLFERARVVAHELPEVLQVELGDAHPRLGAPPASVSALSFREQGYDTDAAEALAADAAAERDRVARDLENLNREYEWRFATVSLGLSQLSGSIEVPTTVLMAGSVILTVPIIVLFFFSERWLAGGLTAGAEKG